MDKTISYNKGDQYENIIHRIIFSKQLTDLPRAGAGGGIDISINKNKDQIINIEVKSDGADYGQKVLGYINGWYWVKPDEVTELYDQMNVIGMIDPHFVPKNANHQNLTNREWAKERRKLITQKEKDYDQSNFEKSRIPLSLDALFQYYKLRDCYYIQIDGSGFYHMAEDKFNLGTKEYDGVIHLRLRAKSIHSHEYRINGKKIKSKREFNRIKMEEETHLSSLNNQYEIIDTPWHYGFYAVIKENAKPTFSEFSIESGQCQKFPNFI